MRCCAATEQMQQAQVAHKVNELPEQAAAACTKLTESQTADSRTSVSYLCFSLTL